MTRSDCFPYSLFFFIFKTIYFGRLAEVNICSFIAILITNIISCITEHVVNMSISVRAYSELQDECKLQRF